MTLTEFVTERLDEDQAIAEEALERGFGGWEYFADRGVNFEARTHIARHDPARVLAQVAAMRAIVADCADYIGSEAVTDGLSARTLERFAAVWSSHPDYDPAWAPEGE